jgi:hypothetical protein
VKPAKFSLSRLLMAAVLAWIVFLTIIILLDPRGSGPVP